MDAMDAILKRRSIRKYTKQQISNKIIKELLKAAVSAPSAGNQQPWHFIIIDNQRIFDEIPKFHPSAKILKDADKAILVCGDLNQEKFKGYWILDCSAATENILIAAHAIGLGACWLGVYPREERIIGMKKLLNIPEHVIPLSLISLGFPAEQKTSEDRYNSARIHHNKW